MRKFFVTAAAMMMLVVPAAASAAPDPSPEPDPKPFRNSRVWIGGPRIPGPSQNQAYLDDPGTVEIWSVTPLNAVAGLQPFFPRVWEWQNSRSLTRCVFGWSRVLGPYGTSHLYHNKGGCTP